MAPCLYLTCPNHFSVVSQPSSLGHCRKTMGIMQSGPLDQHKNSSGFPVPSPSSITQFLHPVPSHNSVTQFHHAVSSPSSFTQFHHPVPSPSSITLFLHPVPLSIFVVVFRWPLPCVHTTFSVYAVESDFLFSCCCCYIMVLASTKC